MEWNTRFTEKVRTNMVLKRSNPFGQQWIKILIPFFIVVVLSCGLIPRKKVFKYFQVKWSRVIEKIVYSDKKALNNLIIEMKADRGNLNILCIPFTPREYQEYLLEISKADHAAVSNETIELEISGRKLKAFEKTVDRNKCYINCSDYYEGIAFLISYSGSCNISTGLRPVLASIRYRFSKETANIARRDFLDIMNLVENMSVPVYEKASDIQKEYSLAGLGKRITYRVEIEPHSLEIFNFYRRFFAAKGWKPYDTRETEGWFQDRLFYTWIDRTAEIFARLLILSEPNTSVKDAKMPRQRVLIDLMPYMVLQWGEKEIGGNN